MSSDESTSPENDAPTEPPESGPGPLQDLFGLLDMVSDTAAELRKPSPDGRPKEIWVRWKIVNGITELTAAGTYRLEKELAEGEYEGRFR